MGIDQSRGGQEGHVGGAEQSLRVMRRQGSTE